MALAGCGRGSKTTVGAPPKLVSAPKLLGLKLAAAEARIVAAGLCPGSETIDPTRTGDHVIVRQVPAPGKQVPANSHVSVAIGVDGPAAVITDASRWPKRCRGY